MKIQWRSKFYICDGDVWAHDSASHFSSFRRKYCNFFTGHYGIRRARYVVQCFSVTRIIEYYLATSIYCDRRKCEIYWYESSIEWTSSGRIGTPHSSGIRRTRHYIF